MKTGYAHAFAGAHPLLPFHKHRNTGSHVAIFGHKTGGMYTHILFPPFLLPGVTCAKARLSSCHWTIPQFYNVRGLSHLFGGRHR